MNLLAYEDVIKSMYEDGHTDTEISYRLSELGMQRGNSALKKALKENASPKRSWSWRFRKLL